MHSGDAARCCLTDAKALRMDGSAGKQSCNMTQFVIMKSAVCNKIFCAVSLNAICSL